MAQCTNTSKKIKITSHIYLLLFIIIIIADDSGVVESVSCSTNQSEVLLYRCYCY
jgi:hypothetical protein